MDNDGETNDKDLSRRMMNHLYIVECTVSKELGVVKFGRTKDLRGRLTAFRAVFPDVRYRYVYSMAKEDCYSAEKAILESTIDLRADHWKTEWRKMSPQRLHRIVVQHLAEANIDFEVKVDPADVKSPDRVDRPDLDRRLQELHEDLFPSGIST